MIWKNAFYFTHSKTTAQCTRLRVSAGQFVAARPFLALSAHNIISISSSASYFDHRVASHCFYYLFCCILFILHVSRSLPLPRCLLAGGCSNCMWLVVFDIESFSPIRSPSLSVFIFILKVFGRASCARQLR